LLKLPAMRFRLLALALALALPACNPGVYNPGPGPTPDSGRSQSADGSGGMGGMPASDGAPASADAGIEAGASGTGVFGAPCTSNADCQSMVCFMGGLGSYCSLRCTTGADCPIPPTLGQCNLQGYCKR